MLILCFHTLGLKLWDKADQIDYVCINSIIGNAYFIPILIWWAWSVHELWPRFATCHLRMLGVDGIWFGDYYTQILYQYILTKLYSNKRRRSFWFFGNCNKKIIKLNKTCKSHSSMTKKEFQCQCWIIFFHVQFDIGKSKSKKSRRFLHFWNTD